MSAAPETLAYLRALFDDMPGFIDVRLMGPDDERPRRQPVDSIEKAATIASGAEGVNVYVGIATRGTGGKAEGEGGKANLCEARAVWVDIDFASSEDEALADARVQEFPNPPSMSIRSGGGLHLYWLLDEPFSLTCDMNVDRFENVLKGIAEYLGGDFAATDAPRILRVPGTMNHPNARKREKGRRVAPCKIDYLHPDIAYPFDSFDMFEDRGAEYLRQRVEATEYDREAFDGKCPARVLRLVEGKRDDGTFTHPKLAARWAGDVTDLGGNQGASELDQAVSNFLAFEGVKAADIENALRYRRQQAGDRAKHSGYYALTIAKAQAAAKQRDHERAERQAEEARAKAADAAHGFAETNASSEPSKLEDGSDDGMAERLVRLFGEDLLFTTTSGWRVWDGKRFRRDTKEAHSVGEKARESARRLHADAWEAPDDQRGELTKRAERARQWRSVQSAVKMAERDPRVRIEPNDLDSNGLLLNVQNGTLDLNTGELRPHSRRDRLTALSPFAYDPKANAVGWLEWLHEFQPDPEVRLFLQRLAGSCAVGITGKETAAIHHGHGANGKTTYIESVRDVLGRDYCAEMKPETLLQAKGGSEMEYHFVVLPGRRMATTLEPAEGKKLNEAAIKRITSSEPVVARERYHEAWEFTPVCTVMVATNHRPEVSGTDDGIWRRVALVPWTQTISADRKDVRFREKLVRAEGPGILAWIVQGARDYLENGLPRPEAVTDATADYRVESDVVGAFLSERCNQGNSDALFCPSAELLKAFNAYAKEQGEGELSARAFADRMARRGIQKKPTKTGKRWLGIDITLEYRAELRTKGLLHG